MIRKLNNPMTIRIIRASRVARERLSYQPSGFEGFRALLVEDNVINQKVASGFLQKLGALRVVIAANEDAALSALEQKCYDIIFMDCQTPEMDGFETTSLIRQRESPGTRTPVVAITAQAMEGDREKCLEAGMDDYFSKPVGVCELRRVLQKFFGSPSSSSADREEA